MLPAGESRAGLSLNASGFLARLCCHVSPAGAGVEMRTDSEESSHEPSDSRRGPSKQNLDPEEAGVQVQPTRLSCTPGVARLWMGHVYTSFRWNLPASLEEGRVTTSPLQIRKKKQALEDGGQTFARWL